MKLAILLHGGVDRSGEDKVMHVFIWLLERLARRHKYTCFALNQEPRPGNWERVGTHVHNIGPGRGWRRRLAATFATQHRASPSHVLHRPVASSWRSTTSTTACAAPSQWCNARRAMKGLP